MSDIIKFWMWTIGCLSIVSVVLISCVTYYNVKNSKIVIQLAEMGYSPAVMRCTEISWRFDNDHDMCKMVLSQENLTRKEAEKIILELKED